MGAPYPYQIPGLNMLLGAFASWGVGKWATIQDVAIRSSIGIETIEAEGLAKYLLDDGYIKHSNRLAGYNLAQTMRGMEDIPYYDHGFELTPKGKQFHLDGGYRGAIIFDGQITVPLNPIVLLTPAITPTKKPGSHTPAKPIDRGRFRTWVSGHPWASVFGAIALVVFTVWLSANWDGHFRVKSFRSMVGLDTTNVSIIDSTAVDSAITAPSIK